jgi:hypothetical protein
MSTIQLTYRNAKIAKDFIPGGETANDFGVQAKLRLRQDLELQARVQYESWMAPVLSLSRQRDVTSEIQLTFWPKKLTAQTR